MYFAAAPIWNDIARTQKLKTQWAKFRFSMNDTRINEAFDVESKHLEAVGINSTVIHSYLTMKPLLLENVAISQFIMDTERIDLRSALPEICSVEEAVIVANMEKNGTMTDLQQKQLAGLLRASLPGNRSKDFISFVSRKEFDKALKTIRTAYKYKKPFSLALVFKKTSLLLESATASVEIPLTAIVGNPKGSFSFQGQTMLSLAETFTGKDLHFSLIDGKFKIDHFALPWRVTA